MDSASKVSAPDIIALERISARAWPAAREASIGGWRLYASSGFSGRINACWPLADPGRSVAEAVAAVEAWYRAQGMPCLFKVAEAAPAPPGLTQYLSEIGYRPRADTLVMTGGAGGLGAPEVRLGEDVDDSFAAIFASTTVDPAEARERLETLGRVPAPRAFARLDALGAPAAIGACAVDAQWVGIFAMRTDPRHRRQGLARRVLAALLENAAAAGAARAWLQVEAANPGAIALYAAAGFSEAYRYRYWFRPERSS